MALADLTFKLYTNAGLTTLFTGLYQLVHKTDLSDNPQDFQLWFGSNTASRQLQTTTSPGTNNITLTPVENLPAWQASTAYIVGQTVEPTVDNGFRYTVTIAGTSSATEPATWPTSGIGSTVSDGTVTWALTSATHEPTEIKLAANSGGLAGATAGAALSLGTTLTSGVGNAVQVNMRVTNAVTTTSANTSYPELSVNIVSVTESAV
jgi:hypothetical protein